MCYCYILEANIFPCYQKANARYELLVYSPRPHPVKLNNLPQCKARLRPQAGRPGPGFSPLCTLTAWQLFQGQETSHHGLPLTPHTHICTQPHTPNDLTISPIRFCHLFLRPPPCLPSHLCDLFSLPFQPLCLLILVLFSPQNTEAGRVFIYPNTYFSLILI